MRILSEDIETGSIGTEMCRGSYMEVNPTLSLSALFAAGVAQGYSLESLAKIRFGTYIRPYAVNEMLCHIYPNVTNYFVKCPLCGTSASIPTIVEHLNDNECGNPQPKNREQIASWLRGLGF